MIPADLINLLVWTTILCFILAVGGAIADWADERKYRRKRKEWL